MNYIEMHRLIRDSVAEGVVIRLETDRICVIGASPGLLRRLKKNRHALLAFLRAARQTSEHILSGIARLPGPKSRKESVK